jgi:type II secretory pathway pseudopilin PulG
VKPAARRRIPHMRPAPSGLWCWSPLTGSGGFILLEVMVATVLVGLIVASLGTALAGTVERARTARHVAVTQSGRADADARRAWEWGPRVIAAWWRPGPVLHAKISGVGGGSAVGYYVGLWTDGWLVDEALVPGEGADGTEATGELQVPAQTWSGRADRELVLRVRTAEGAWGPPWRLAVAGPGGGDPALGSPLGVPPLGPTIVAHRPGTGTSSLTTSWSAGALACPPFGLLFVLDPAVLGWEGATLDGRSQWWRMEDGRSADLYF